MTNNKTTSSPLARASISDHAGGATCAKRRHPPLNVDHGGSLTEIMLSTLAVLSGA
jgi:hypothetical protein